MPSSRPKVKFGFVFQKNLEPTEPDQKPELDNYWGVLTSMVLMDTGCQHPWLPIGVGVKNPNLTPI